MKIKTSNLTGKALDWAVAQCEGKVKGYAYQLVDDARDMVPYCPSETFEQGGPILERAGISTKCCIDRSWYAYSEFVEATASGPTLLIVGMRCYVASKLGNEIEVPDELA